MSHSPRVAEAASIMRHPCFRHATGCRGLRPHRPRV